jgi:putative nucleotidyltransferase with HDIG domain
MLTSYKRRSTFLKASLFLSLINIITIFIFSLISKTTFTLNTLLMMGMGVAGGLSAGILVAGLMPVFETLFGYTTDIRLLELANLNQPIFQQMILEAPGTYHHSIIVGSLVEAAAEAIGANSLLVKVSAYYHDIGKLEKPQYYIENQKKGENLHDRLSPKMSSLVIISHVKDGCELAESLKLCREVVNIIREHHGTSKVGYFFEKAQKDPDPSIRSLPEIDFRYPGPKPQTKEAALVLIGDVVEASSRSLDNPTPSRIEHLVHERIDRIFLDGQLDESELTLKDLNIIAESFIRILHGIFHQRIDYSEPVVREFTGSSKNSNDYNHRKPSEAN